MTCFLPIMFILNAKAVVIKELKDYKIPDQHATMAYNLCKRKTGTCPKSVSVFPSGHIHVTCKRKKK